MANMCSLTLGSVGDFKSCWLTKGKVWPVLWYPPRAFCTRSWLVVGNHNPSAPLSSLAQKGFILLRLHYSGYPKSWMLVWPIQSMDTQHAILQYLHSPDTLPLQILTQEDWNKVLYNGMASTSSWAALYFIALMTFGNYVLFNLLVAILVEGFQTEVMSSCSRLYFLLKF